MSLFNRYRSLVTDWDAFQDALARPLPTCLWANTLRTNPKQLATFLAADGLEFERLPWHPTGFKLAPDFKPGRHWTFLAGLCHVQGEASMLPVLLLDPQPGERVLDLCAAPGGKTAQISVLMQNSGTVVANDINAGRMRATRQTLERLGLVNVVTTICDGANYPGRAGLFDRILVDAPCTCEGTSRKDAAVVGRVGSAVSLKKMGLQTALLRKAVQLCRPGGVIVYSTCTYAPEENEKVVDAVLSDYGPAVVRLQSISLPPEFVASPGVTGWRGYAFDPTLAHSRRVWPHQNNTGGFFIAVLEKEAGDACDSVEPALYDMLPLPPSTADKWATVTDRFGLGPAQLRDYALFQPGKRQLYLTVPEIDPPPQPLPDAIGMQLMKTHSRYPKLSTTAAMLLGPKAARNSIDLDEDQMQAYINRQNFQISAAQQAQCNGNGYVLVRYRGFVLGVGLYRPGQGDVAEVESLYPKGWSPNKQGL